MTTLEAIEHFIVPVSIIRGTDLQLRSFGEKGCECFVLWSGVSEQSTFHIRTMHVPSQTAYRFRDGLCVRVDGSELHRINLWLYGHGEHLAVQVHSHPTDAYHSETDDAYPIVTVRGALSLVVPDFARLGLRGRGVACYRLCTSGWARVSDNRLCKLLVIKE